MKEWGNERDNTVLDSSLVLDGQKDGCWNGSMLTVGGRLVVTRVIEALGGGTAYSY